MIERDASEDAQRISTLYWEIKDDGTWARTVGSIGVVGDIGAVVAAHSYATLLNCPCANCSEPITVTNRSWANKVGGKNLDVEAPAYLCGECTKIRQQEETERQQRAAEQKRIEREHEQQAERLQRLVANVLADEGRKAEPADPLPKDSPLALALYVALISYATRNPGKPLPSLTSTGPLGWTGDAEQDRELLSDLYHAKLLALAPESPPQAFTLSQDGDGIAFFSTEVAWRVVGGLTAAQERVTKIEELANVIRKGFAHGYTSGQMICFAWRAADSAAAWKERNPRMGPPEAASASVTSLNGKIDKAIELHHSIPEYEAPRWHASPLALACFRRLHADIRRVYAREVIDACTQCDHLGLKETVHPETGADTVWRCTHPVEIPAQPHGEEEPSGRDDAPDPAGV